MRSYHNISKNEIKSQPFEEQTVTENSAKLPQYFKERNQITTGYEDTDCFHSCEVTTIFQRTKSNHNNIEEAVRSYSVRSYHNISKNEIKSQLVCVLIVFHFCAKLPQYFKERNQITTPSFLLTFVSLCEVTTIFQRTKSNHNIRVHRLGGKTVRSYHNISKNEIKSQLL